MTLYHIILWLAAALVLGILADETRKAIVRRIRRRHGRSYVKPRSWSKTTRNAVQSHLVNATHGEPRFKIRRP